jgi:hypothetical protein
MASYLPLICASGTIHEWPSGDSLSLPNGIIDASGNIGLGTSSLISGDFNIVGAAVSPMFGLYVFNASDTTINRSGQVNFYRANGTQASPTAIKNNDRLGIFGFNGHNGSVFGNQTAAVIATATENWTASANGSAMAFGITRSGTATRITALQLDTVAGNWLPGSDNAQNVGSASLRMGTVYAGTGSINTSDETEKQWRGPLSDDEIAAGKEIFSEIGAFQFLDAIARKGEEAARLHIGLRAQRVGEILASRNLDPSRYGLYCYDDWEAIPGIPAQYDDAGELLSTEVPERPAGGRYGIRPDELAYFLLAVIDRRLAALEA